MPFDTLGTLRDVLNSSMELTSELSPVLIERVIRIIEEPRYKGANLMTDGFLKEYYIDNTGKRLHKWLHYFDIYEQHFSRFRERSPVMLEIGVFGGGSLEMWREYFGKGCKLVGIDINPECKKHEAPDIEIFIGGQQDPAVIKQVLSQYPKIDIVLDDGSHKSPHMIETFKMLYDQLDPNGVYMIEDTHACYWKEMSGGPKYEGSFIEFVKDKVDEINAPISRGQVPITPITRSTRSISFYDSIIVFEKKPQGVRQCPPTGLMGEVGTFQ